MSASIRRPEHKAPPEIFYDVKEAQKYTSSSRMMQIQEQLTERALELLALSEDGPPQLLLDLGCGSGLSGETITESGHLWVGCDISSAMLDVARERQVDGDCLLADLGDGLPFRAGCFDGAVSVSALQWLCNADKSWHSPVRRLQRLFGSLYACLSRGSRAVFQFYPENSAQVEMITGQAMRAGFSGGLVVDFPNSSKAKKMFLVLMTGGGQTLPSGLGDQDQKLTAVFSKRERMQQLRGKAPKKSRNWILEKKERRRNQGREVTRDSKYTGRKRKGGF